MKYALPIAFVSIYCSVYMCAASSPSVVVLSDAGECLYWYYKDAPDKRNPCGIGDSFVPENAEVAED